MASFSNSCIVLTDSSTDSFLNPIDTKTAIDHYGYDIIFMLYRAMHDYLKGEEALVEALEKVIGYIFAPRQ